MRRSLLITLAVVVVLSALAFGYASRSSAEPPLTPHHSPVVAMAVYDGLIYVMTADGEIYSGGSTVMWRKVVHFSPPPDDSR